MDTRDFPDRVAAVGALGDPVRRRLFQLVTESATAIGRDEAAELLGISRSTAAFHLDRLATDGLLTVGFQRRTGRTGPGAGRPAKLYSRTATEVTVTVPDRRYELAAQLLADALASAVDGRPVDQAVADSAYDAGHELARTTGDIEELLAVCGFRPEPAGDDILLRHCPFHQLAVRHTALICGMNLALLAGALDALDPDPPRTAVLDPGPDRCCVRLSATGASHQAGG